MQSQYTDRCCPVCTGAGVVVSGEFDGYVEGYRVSILECSECSLRYSSRLDVPPRLYEAIYRNADVLPGYDRYARYAREIRASPDPLAYLAASELPYRFADLVVRGLPRDAVVVDFGCGEGYLTYALRTAGLECYGVDLAATAVERARRRFGRADWFVTPAELASADFTGADLVVALEVIEHVPAPVDLVRSMSKLVKPGGRILLTTPNRDACSTFDVWSSDLPPVHLLLFNRRSMAELARQAGCTPSFPYGSDDPMGDATPPGESWPPLLTPDWRPSTVVRKVRGVPWRLRTRLELTLTRAARLVGDSPRRSLPGVGGHRPPATLAATLAVE
jgi:SAM-dependent methyltransferase